MPLLLDLHAHIYPQYEIESALYYALYNLATIRASYTYGMCLTERDSENYFEELQKKEFSFLNIKKIDNVTLLVDFKNAPEKLYIFSGQQFITKEKIEVLSLISIKKNLSSLSLSETVDEIVKNGGIPVLPWSFGKWWGRRGFIINNYLKIADRKKVFLGDIPLRVLSDKLHSDIRILAGSDPLPVSREEELIGGFATEFKDELDISNPGRSAYDIVLNNSSPIIRGLRDSTVQAIRRILAFHMSKFLKK